MISLIAAVGKNLELGKDGELLWHLPEDFKYFKEVTMGHPILMGHKTFSSLPNLLSGRKHIILTRHPEILEKEIAGKHYTGKKPEIEIITQLFDVIDKYKASSEELFVIGGGNMFKQTIEYADKLYLTEISGECEEADVYFPEFNKEHFKKEVVAKGRDEKYGLNYSFVVYTRK